MYKTIQPPCGRGNAFPLWWLAPPPFRPAGKRVTGFSVAYGSLRIQFPCHRKRGHYGRLAMEPCLCRKHRNLFCPLNRGKSGAARIGGGERSEPVSRIVILSYDTESKSRNVLASPLGEEGHEVAKGCTRVRMIMILDVDVTAERRHYNIHRPRGRYQNPRPERPSNLSPLRTFGAKPRQPSCQRRGSSYLTKSLFRCMI